MELELGDTIVIIVTARILPPLGPSDVLGVAWHFQLDMSSWITPNQALPAWAQQGVGRGVSSGL